MTDDDGRTESAPGIRNAHSLLASVLGDGVNQPDGEDPRDPDRAEHAEIIAAPSPGTVGSRGASVGTCVPRLSCWE